MRIRNIFNKIIILVLFNFISSFIYANETEYFNYAKKQISKYNPKIKSKCIIVDYRKNILQERLFFLDMTTSKIVLSSTVSHAWNSGKLYATIFTNNPNTNTSSKGNYLTLGTKYGKFGYSMLLEGLDAGVNTNAKIRDIIFHSNKEMKTKWSYGCFATPENKNKKIIELTKGGVLVCVITK